MTVFNNATYVADAVSSVLAQDFPSFEFIIVDDGSTDATPALLAPFAQEPPVVLLRNESNLGIPTAANRGLRLAQGEFVARMDADDVMLAGRLREQVRFLTSHPEVGVVGGQRDFMDASGKTYPTPMRVSTSHNLIAWRVFLGGPFVHPTTMIRRQLLEDIGGYDERYRYASDLELWTRLLFKCRFANLPDVYLHYRVHETNTSQLWRMFPAPPPPRAVLAERLLGEAVPAERFNQITRALWSGHRVTRDEAEQLSGFLVRLFVAMAGQGLFTTEISDVAEEVTRQVTRIARLAPVGFLDSLLDLVRSHFATRTFTIRGFARPTTPPALRRFFIERNSARNKPLL